MEKESSGLSLCNTCCTPLRACQWCMETIPIPGWIALPKIQKLERGKQQHTYIVSYCPMYKGDPNDAL